MPAYRHACTKEAPVVLKNDFLRLEMYKRSGGWGWGEIYTPGGMLFAVLDHLGEVLARDMEIPMRLEAQEVRTVRDEDGESLVFPVVSSVIPEKLKGSSFSNWMNYPLNQPVMEGTVSIKLMKDQPVLKMSHRLRSKVNLNVSYLRGPWLKVGESSFGTEKEDAIFPGVDWVCGREWSSGKDWFKDPWAKRFAPHPNEVSIPLMAISRGGYGIGLSWDPNRVASRWFNGRDYHCQPVFAAPNFIDRAENQLMGIMLPDARTEAEENRVYAEPAMDLHMDQAVAMDAEIFLCRGNSLQVVVNWVKRHGLPEAGDNSVLEGALERIARAYNTNLWFPEKGFGCRQNPDAVGTKVPPFLKRYVREHAGDPLSCELEKKIAWCEKNGQLKTKPADEARRAGTGEQMLSLQQPDGSFLFDPDGRHYVKDDFVVSRDYLEPMGLAGDTALDICLLPVLSLFDSLRATGEEKYRAAARKTLDFCLKMTRPEGGDYWETPLHSPNLFAAGHAAIAYYLGYREFGDPTYRHRAVYWIRSLLPFTHLWQPAGVAMLYNTKPCLCSSDWYFANWVRDHVQWEVLEVFADSAGRGIDWGSIDPEIDWHRYHRGITAAAVRWMIDRKKDSWRPHNMPWTLDMYREGAFDGCFPDTHNSITGNYGGMAIMPEAIANNIYAVLDRDSR